MENQEIFKIDNEMLDLWVNEKHGNIRYLIFNIDILYMAFDVLSRTIFGWA